MRGAASCRRVPPRVIACSPSFSLSKCLLAAVAAEDDAPPDIEQVHASKRMLPPQTDGHSAALPRQPTDADFTRPLLSPRSSSRPIPEQRRVSYHYDMHEDRDKARKRAKRAQNRAKEFSANAHNPRPGIVQQHVASSPSVPISIPLGGLPVNSSGYDALSKDSGVRKPLKYQDLVDEGYVVHEWDGRCVCITPCACSS